MSAEGYNVHEELGAYLMGLMRPQERARFQAHLAGCSSCRREERTLGGVTALLDRIPAPFELPGTLEEDVRGAVARAARGGAAERRSAPRLPLVRRRPSLALAGAMLLIAGVVGGALLYDGGRETRTTTITEAPRKPGTFELSAILSSARDPGIRGRAEVRETGFGRVINFASDDLRILPKGEFYELWFVGPGDTFANPNRISAGTFHPDDEGRSRLSLFAAVDPKKYPVLSVTSEPGDGNPRRTGREVLRSDR